ncbi:ABC transporter substrate-binding protein [Lichenihabitans sp. PAMC28606]|uniref:ABC transporter substrate-binding protein n=1 Tax=Lichenihabitans sp. PAMC28606 TaxID=2880932 RepID=UPI001D0BC067|nr:ABC transporter substrate-binding protein [Lichenihabitans sp. PAMC28606]UDL94175.1 ABC transporter substrate-binding protein [Lichenihabitans sp. PAMC28606]
MSFKRTSYLAAAAAVLGLAGEAHAADNLTLQLKWVTQGQFAGYYVAQDKGFYKDAGLDVTIKPGGPDIAPEQVIAAGGADVIVDWMPAALAAREKGEPLVNIAQIFEKSAQMTTCRADTGIKTPADFKGKTIGVWFGGNEYPFLTWMNKLGYTYEGASPNVTLLKQGFNVDPLLQKQADCIATMVYNEYHQILESGQLKKADLVTFKWQDQGIGMLEDGLYTTEAELKDPKKADALARFVKASIKGWEYVAAHQDETVAIILKNDTTGAQTKEHQTTMVQEIVPLLEGSKGVGYLDPADYKRTVQILLDNKVLTTEPKGAWTHKIYDAATKP